MGEEFQPTMSEMRIPRESLIEALEKNLKAHREEYEAAMEGYWETLTMSLRYQLDCAMNRTPIERNLHTDKPKDHSKHYESAIRMLQMSADNFVVISKVEFNTYVMDDWSWKEEFSSVASNYTQKK